MQIFGTVDILTVPNLIRKEVLNMRIDFLGMIELEIDWRAIGCVSAAVGLYFICQLQ